jgi:hypothetical protein
MTALQSSQVHLMLTGKMVFEERDIRTMSERASAMI